MTMEAASAGHAFLDLYDLTGDKAYYDRALGIADTYVRLQREDGSLPIKVDFVTGEPVNDACAMLHPCCVISSVSKPTTAWKPTPKRRPKASGGCATWRSAIST